ncbi:hypothetical protein BX666DRAFT_1883775 [Dichotomocladium elegans]|nr:hypothetical protein BX666DRAFT_1883775 [Dichotomocladium elegans]
MRRYRAVLEASGINCQGISTSSLSSSSSSSSTSSDNNNSIHETPDVEMILTPETEQDQKLPRPAILTVHPSCSECPVKYSPYWWQLGPTSKVVCQRCYWSHQQHDRTNQPIA